MVGRGDTETRVQRDTEIRAGGQRDHTLGGIETTGRRDTETRVQGDIETRDRRTQRLEVGGT